MKRRHGSVAPSFVDRQSIESGVRFAVCSLRFAEGGGGGCGGIVRGSVCDGDAREGFGFLLPGRQCTGLERNLSRNPIVLLVCSFILFGDTILFDKRPEIQIGTTIS